MGFWGCGLEEGVFFVRCRPGSGLSPYGRVRALPWFSFGLTPSKGKVAVFLKESRLKNFYARCARRPVSLLYDLFRLMAPLEQRLPQGASRCLAMTDSQGQGVGGIIGLGDFLQSQQPPGHLLDLGLYRFAVARHRLLHLHGGILIQGHAVLGQGEENHPPGLRHADAGGLIVGEIELFHGGGLGL